MRGVAWGKPVKRTAIASTVLLLLIPAALSGCGGSGGSASAAQASTTPAGATLPDETKAEEDQDAISVAVGAVRREPLSSLYSTSATLRADKRATITARTTGVVRMLLVEEGDRVETGEPLAELENDEQKISFQRASTASDTLLRDFERTRRLHQDGLVSDEEFENYNPLEDAGGPDWDVFDGAGRYLGVVTLPARFAPRIIIGDKIYVSHGHRSNDTALLSVYDIGTDSWTHGGVMYPDAFIPSAEMARSHLGHFNPL